MHDDPERLVEALLREGRIDAETFAALIPPGLAEAEAAARIERLRARLVAPGLAPDPTRADRAPFGPEMPTSHRYDLRSALGRGGMGEVVLARDRVLARDVAVKALLPESQASEDARGRFLHEAKATAALAHPGIIPVYDLGVLPDGRWFYAMQRIAGQTLSDLKAQIPDNLPRLMTIFSRVCHTVAYAHDHGMIHRDLKPENVLVGDYGEVYVADWGLAKRVAESEPIDESLGVTFTSPGVILGTIHYMSPEQLQDQPLTTASDVWALGVILFELLTLQHPFADSSVMGMTIRVLTGSAPDPRAVAPSRRAVPDDLAELCLAALEGRAEERTLTARHMAERAMAFVDGEEERSRRRTRAADQLARARAQGTEYRRGRERLEAERARLRTAREGLRASTPRAERERVWALDRSIQQAELTAEGVYARAVQLASQSLEDWETREAHDFLADLVWGRAEEAARAGDAPRELYFRSLAARHDRGLLATRLARSGTLSVRVDAPGARVRLERCVPFGPLLRPEPVDRPAGPLSFGTYIVQVEAPGRMTARVPVCLDAAEPMEVVVTPPAIFPGHEALVYVAGGRHVVGGDDQAPQSLPEQWVEVAPFLIARYPVTMAEYCEFLDDVARTDLPRAVSHAPRSTDGSVCYLEFCEVSRRFRIPEVDRDGDRWDPDWPALMLSWHDAVAWCAWRTARDGVEHRLPTEIEWEVAARGVDRRAFPWGSGFDPTLCRMADSVEGATVPVPVGTYELDVSPYGVRDLAGLVIEWTATPLGTGEYIQRGGAFTSPAPWCRAAARRSNHAAWNSSAFGFRYVRAL